MKNRYSKQKDRQLLIRFKFKSPYVTSRKNILGKDLKGIGLKAIKHHWSTTWHRAARYSHQPLTQLSSGTGPCLDFPTWILQWASSALVSRARSRPLMRVPNSATGTSGFPKHRTKPLPGMRVAEIFLFLQLCKRRVIPQPRTQLGTFHNVSKQTISYTHNAFQKENVINPQTKHHTATGKTPSHFPSEREGVDRTW